MDLKGSHRPVIAVAAAVANRYAEKEMIIGITSRAQSLGYDTLVFSNIYNLSEPDEDLVCERRIYELIRSEQIDAVIVMSESFEGHDLRQTVADIVDEKDVPVVVAGSRLPEFENEKFVHINTSDEDDLDILTSHLIEEHGFTEIDMLTGLPGFDVSLMRMDGYKRAMKRHGIEPEDRHMHFGDYWYTSGEELADKYISGQLPMPQAVVCANDIMAYGVLSKLAENGVKVPEQITVVSYEYSDLRIFYSPLLTSYRRDRAGLGRIAVDIIHDILNGIEPPEFVPPEGHFVFGESCPCEKDEKQYLSDLKYAAVQRNYEHYNLFCTMEQKLTACRSMDEFISIIGEHQWLIRYVQNVYLCLFNNWYETASPTVNKMTCRTIMPWLDNSPFEADRFQFSAITERENAPAVYYFNPIFVGSRLMGHMILKYDNPDGYDDIFRNWLKSVTNSLEFLRMKNDIRYLLSCQNLSESRDTLTGMYNEKGLRRAFSAVRKHGDRELFFVSLRICLFNDSVYDLESGKNTDAIIAAANAVNKFCGNHDIAGHISENTFVCIVQSCADADTLADALSAILIQQNQYLTTALMDSFVCSAVVCEDRSFSELMEMCTLKNSETVSMLSERRSRYHYQQMIRLRTQVYSSPEITFDPIRSDELIQENHDSFRLNYKKCFGISFHQDCIAARIARAKYYLITTSLGMADIADKCGYIDNKYFLRQFSSNVGRTAVQYRNLIKR